MTVGDAPLQPVPEPIVPEGTPLLPQHLVDIFFRPGHFFSSQLALGKTPYVIFVTWMLGLASAIDRVDQEMMKVDLGTARAHNIADLVGASWLSYWGFVLAIGACSGVFLWYLGGWWYKVRVGWSGETDPDPKTARLVYVYASFVAAMPAVLLMVAWTLMFQDYATAWADESLWPVAILIFPFWSCYASYRGVTSVFDVSTGKAFVWFALLPGVIYSLAVVGVITAYFIAGQV